MKQLLQQLTRDPDMEGGDRVGIMAFGPDAANLAGGSPAPAPGLIIQDGRRGRRGKNGSARQSGTHKLRYIKVRDVKAAPTPSLVVA